MDPDPIDAAFRVLETRRVAVRVAIAGFLGALGVASIDAEAGKRARKRRRRRRKRQERLCHAVCGGSCRSCRQQCAICPEDCPICSHRVGADRVCGPDVATTACTRCDASADCGNPAFPTCATGFTDVASGTTRRFASCGDYPAGICVKFAVLCAVAP